MPPFQDGVAFVVVNYTLAPKATMDEIVQQNRARGGLARRHARELGIDPARLVRRRSFRRRASDGDGHDRERSPPPSARPRSRARRLRDQRRSTTSSRSASAISTTCSGSTPQRETQHSPLRHLAEASSPPLIVSVGTGETDEFLRQQDALSRSGLARGLLPLAIADQPGDHHFEVVDRLGEREKPLASRGHAADMAGRA